jgi:ubiquinone/menaquinone biosynthesis C-methylase UbiE
MSAYDEIAQWYNGWVAPSMQEDAFFPATEAFLGEVTGQYICDLACGQGRLARHLVGMGARVLGIDLSQQLLAIARRYEENEPQGIEYRWDDAQALSSIADNTFDGVVCNMALMDIPELAPTLAAVARILRPAGWFIFFILHPCYNTAYSGEMNASEGTVRIIARYFTEGHWRSDSRTGPPGKVGSYHRTLSTYVNTLTDAGFVLERLHESAATGALAASRPVWAEVPAILTARCRRYVRQR